MATEPIIAEFSSFGRDLYWRVYAGPDNFIRWIGYDDANWWDNVAPTDPARTRIGIVTGRVFTIDFDTNAVTISQAVEVGGNV